MVIIIDLKTFLKNNLNSRRIFGKRELEIISKQLDGISLTQSERNRLSRDIKPKLEFIKEVNEFKNEFEIKKGQNVRKIIEKAVELMLQDKLINRIKAILLFGSQSKGPTTTRSDIDLCVVFDEIDEKESGTFRVRILSELPDKADVQVFNLLPQKIKRDIARNHKVIYKREGFDNISFTINYLKDEDYFLRMKRVMGETA